MSKPVLRLGGDPEDIDGGEMEGVVEGEENLTRANKLELSSS